MSNEEEFMEQTTSMLAVILKAKLDECVRTLNISEGKSPSGLFCQGTFDGWSCWEDTAADSTATVSCPYFITGFDPTRIAHKYCSPNGTWFRHPESGRLWSNYTTCINVEDLNWRQEVNSIYKIGYVLSLVALLLSLATLTYFKSLWCPRITLHMNLFFSFATNNALWLLWYRSVVPYPEVIFANGFYCQILHAVLHYFLLTNYSWMLAEGFYLHTLLVTTFVSEEILVRRLTVFAWTLPLVFIIAYTLLRFKFNNTGQCWINDSEATNVLVVLVCVSMVLNLLFLCNIVRVLVSKLNTGSSRRPSRNILQALRATLLLVPLLGLHYLLTPFRPPKDHEWEKLYEVVSAIASSFQGLCVAILFCFCNGEVIAQIKRRWNYTVCRPKSTSCTASSVSFVRSTAVPMTDEVTV